MLNPRLRFIHKRLIHSSSNNQVSFLLTNLTNQPSDLKSLRKSHAYIITTGHTNNLFIAAKLISHYATLKEPNLSTRVFDSIQIKDSFLWNSIIKAHFGNGFYSKAIGFYFGMRLSHTLCNQFTIPMIVAACSELQFLDLGSYVHGLVLKLGFFSENSAIGSSFVYMYSKCGVMEDARMVFDEMRVRDVVAWTSLLIGYVQNDESEKGLRCVIEMHKIGLENEKPNFRTLEGGFRACGNLGAICEARCLHGFSIKTGIVCSQDVQSSILSMYSKFGTEVEACFSFLDIPEKDIMSWTSIISVYAKLGCVEKCICLFTEMQVSGIVPDEMLISCMISAFANSMRIFEGKAFHSFIVRRNYKINSMVHSALVSMYWKFGQLDVAHKLLDNMPDRDEESWNSMVIECMKMGMESKGIDMFRKMQYTGIKTYSGTVLSVTASCSKLGAKILCKSLHCYMVKNFIDGNNVSVSNSLIDMYGKLGDLITATKIFSLCTKDTVTWNTLMSSYCHKGRFGDAISLFDKMILNNVNPSSATLITVLSACAQAPSLDKGEQVHNLMKKESIELITNIPLATALLDMYSKCGKLEKSREIFESVKEKDVIMYNVMISGYGMHGDVKSSLEIFEQLEKENKKPNELTFLAILSACNHAGLVEEGKHVFNKMKSYSLKPNLKHYSCMVDLLGRSGNLSEAEDLILSMPIEPDGGLWGTLLTACNVQNEFEMGIRVGKKAIESDPDNDGYYVIISNLYGSTGRWDDAENARNMMKERGVKKIVGWSSL